MRVSGSLLGLDEVSIMKTMLLSILTVLQKTAAALRRRYANQVDAEVLEQRENVTTSIVSRDGI